MSHAAAEKLHDILISMPDRWHHEPPYHETQLGPGQAIAQLSQETRDLLGDLKSDDLRNISLPSYYFLSRRESRRQNALAEVSKMKLKFDELVLRGRHR